MAAVALAVLLGVLAVSLNRPSGPLAQAHDDGTLHIHPTLTPTPSPPPTPLPALGLNGPLSLQTTMVYQKSRHRLVVTATVNNPPPEGWRSQWASASVHVDYKEWSFYTDSSVGDGRLVLHDNVLTANLSLPEYVVLEQLAEPLIAHISVHVQYSNDRRQNELYPSETIFVDLRDRRNWRE